MPGLQKLICRVYTVSIEGDFMKFLFSAWAALAALVSPALANEAIEAEVRRCMRTHSDEVFCRCRITINPHYKFGDPFMRIVMAQECQNTYGDALFH